MLVVTGVAVLYLARNAATLDESSAAQAQICLYYCASAQVLSCSAIVTQLIFLLKFLHSLMRHGNRCILLRAELEYVRPPPRNRGSSSAAGAPPHLAFGGEPSPRTPAQSDS